MAGNHVSFGTIGYLSPGPHPRQPKHALCLNPAASAIRLERRDSNPVDADHNYSGSRRTFMKRLTFLPIVLWAATGCGSKIIDRLDCANYQLDQINQQLCEANKKLEDVKKNQVEGNKIAKENGTKIDTTNKTLDMTNAKLDVANTELGGIKGESVKANKNLETIDGSLGKLGEAAKGIETKIQKNGDIMQKGFDELIKRSPPPKN